MITKLATVPEFLGLITHVDPSQVPLGGALMCANMAQLDTGRLQRIAGIEGASSPAVGAEAQIPLAFWAKGLGAAGADQLVAVFAGTTTVTVVNLSTGASFTGPTLAASSFGKPWTATFYNNKWMFAGGGNTSVYQLDSASTYSLVTEPSKVFTVTIASPAVFTSAVHLFLLNDRVVLSTTGALPTGLTAGTVYYVISAGLTDDAFELSLTQGGAAINTSGTQSGVHNVVRVAAGGNLIQSFLNRLYVADIAGQEGVVKYSDVLSTYFAASSLINVKEIPGAIVSLSVNAVSTAVAGINTKLVISKRAAMWAYDESSKDTVTQVVGQSGAHSGANTEAGYIFLGAKGSKKSIFWLPIGAVGEPIDIGEALNSLLNVASVIANAHLAHAASHGRFWKLFYSIASQDNNPNELWLDTYLLATAKKVVWYGVHNRGSFDASVVADSTLNLFTRGASGVTKHYQEKSSAASGFTDSAGSVMSAVLDMPLNVDPQDEEKEYDVAEAGIGAEANIPGNQVTTEAFADGVSQGTGVTNLAGASPVGIVKAVVPVHTYTSTGMAAKNARLKFTHSLDQRFDVLSLMIQYLVHGGTGRVRG